MCHFEGIEIYDRILEMTIEVREGLCQISLIGIQAWGCTTKIPVTQGEEAGGSQV